MVLVLLTSLNCYMSTLQLVHYALFLTCMLKIQQHKHKTRRFHTVSCFGPHIWKTQRKPCLMVNFLILSFFSFLFFLIAPFQSPPFLRSLAVILNFPAGCIAKLSIQNCLQTRVEETLISEPQNQLLLSVASCIFFQKQGNYNDKLKSAWGEGNYTSTCDFNNYFEVVELLAKQKEDWL